MIKKILTLSVCTFALGSFGMYSSEANAANLQAFEDDAQIVAAGTISNLSDDEFVLMVDGQSVNVDYREWNLLDFTDLRNHLKNGEKVVITGEVDDNWYAEDEIEADSIYFTANNNFYSVDDSVPTYYVYYYDRDLGADPSSGSDMASGDNTGTVSDATSSDTGSERSISASEIKNPNMVTITGDVTSLMDEKFTMQTDAGAIKVNMKPLSPDREESRLHVEKGDNVLVYGNLNEDLLKNGVLTADTVVKLNKKNK